MRDQCEIMCSHCKAMASQYTRNEQNQYSLKCTVLRHSYWSEYSCDSQTDKTITENENMTVSHTNKLSFHHKGNNASFGNISYK